MKTEDHELWITFIRDQDENLVGIMAELPFQVNGQNGVGFSWCEGY